MCHDHAAGRSTVWHATDLVRLARASKGGLSAVDAARALFDLEVPTANHKEKARRRLEGLTQSGLLQVVQVGDQGSRQPTKWAGL